MVINYTLNHKTGIIDAAQAQPPTLSRYDGTLKREDLWNGMFFLFVGKMM